MMLRRYHDVQTEEKQGLTTLEDVKPKTLDELKEEAKAKKIKGYTKMNEEQLIEALRGE